MAKSTTKKTKTAKRIGRDNPFVSTPDSLITKTICKNIKSLYLEKKTEQGWTQEKFGQFIGTPLSYTKGVLQGNFAPSHAVLLQISKLFGKSMDWLYGLEEAKGRK